MKKEVKNETKSEVFQKAFWLYMVGNILGFLMEGFWCKLKYGRWESHVVSMIGPFCLLYGFGAAIFYLCSRKLKNQNIFTQFLFSCLVGDVVEYICGYFLEHAFGMRAWYYGRYFLNINGYICLFMTVAWGIVGLLFIYFVMPFWDKFYEKIKGKFLTKICYALALIMFADFMFTMVCITRWANRHKGYESHNKVINIIDKKYDDDFMAKRFNEWRFIKK